MSDLELKRHEDAMKLEQLKLKVDIWKRLLTSKNILMTLR